jgi:uncharacterized protein YcgI (DUF1989 family)
MTMNELDMVVPGGFGRGFSALTGQFIAIIDLYGQQAGDFVAVSLEDPREKLSPPHTRRALGSLFFKVGDCLFSDRGRAMFRVVRDDAKGLHDSNVPACDPTRYAVDFGIDDHRNCLENLHEGLAPYGLGILDVPEPFNFFQNGPVGPDGRMRLADPVSRPGDMIVLETLMDVACALSPCPQDIIPGNGLVITDMRVRVRHHSIEE